MKVNADNSPDRAGRSSEQFAAEVGISRAGLYALPDDLKPESVKLGHRRIITESPRDWLARIGEQQRKT